jgi:predicted DNA-binding transcriptional regulator YafY
MASRLERLISLDAYIRSGVCPGIEQLCRIFEVQPRTVYQDLRELKERFALDIRFDRDRNGYYNADPSKRLPAMMMTEDEVVLLSVAAEMLCHFGGPSFRGSLASALDTIAEDKFQTRQQIQAAMRIDHQPDEVSSNTFVRLLVACINRNTVELTYHCDVENRQVKKLVEPHMVHLADGWRLSGKCAETGEQVTVALSRLVDLAPAP